MRTPYLLLLLPLAACGGEPPLVTGLIGPHPNLLRADAKPSLRVAEAALSSGAPQIALNVSAAIVKEEPRNAAAHATYADALFAMGRKAEAGAEYNAALKLRPDLPAARAGLGRALLAAGDARGAEQALRLASTAEARPETLSNLGIALDMQSRHAEAQEVYRQSLLLNPDSAATQVNLGLSLALSGDRAGAANLLQSLQAGPEGGGRGAAALAAALNTPLVPSAGGPAPVVLAAEEAALMPGTAALASADEAPPVARPARRMPAPLASRAPAAVPSIARAPIAAPAAVRLAEPVAEPVAMPSTVITAPMTVPVSVSVPIASPVPPPVFTPVFTPVPTPAPASIQAPARVPARAPAAAPAITVAALSPPPAPAAPAKFDPASVPMPTPYQYGTMMTARAETGGAPNGWPRPSP